MSRWFRFYDEALDDPKVQMLTPCAFKAWVNLLCLASKRGGVLPPQHEIAFALRMTEENACDAINELMVRGLLDMEGEDIRPHNWDNRQFTSDTSSERVKRHREKKRNVSETVSETFHSTKPAVSETPPETETDTETDNTLSRAKAEREFRFAICDEYTKAGFIPPDTGRCVIWLQNGWQQSICVETVRALLAKKGKALPLSYIEPAIADAHAPVPIGSPPNQRAGPNNRPQRETPEMLLRKALNIGEFANEPANSLSGSPNSPVIEGIGYRAIGRP